MARAKHVDYLKSVVEPKAREKAVRGLYKVLKELSFDAIAVRGVSGLGMGAILAYRLKKPLIVVRKGERSHGFSFLEGTNESVRRYVIVDDLVASGETVGAIQRNMDETYGDPKCLGVFVYHQGPGHAPVGGVPVISTRN